MNPNNPYQQPNEPGQNPAPQTPPPYQTLPPVAPAAPAQNWQQTPQNQPSFTQPNYEQQAAPGQTPQNYTGGSPTPPPRPTTPGGTPDRTPPPRPKSYGKAPLGIRIADWIKKNWWAPVVGVLVLAIVGLIIFQIAQPANALPQGTVIDGQDLSGWDKDDAIEALNTAYGDVQTDIYFGDSEIPYTTAEARDVGISVDNSGRLENVSYPFWLRLIPSSYFWASSLNSVGEPLYNYNRSALDSFAADELGSDCQIEPRNATLILEDDLFTVVSAVPGGRCDINEFKEAAGQAVVENGKISIRTSINETPAPLGDDIAQQLADELNHNLSAPMPIRAGGQTDRVPVATVRGWLTFRAVIPEGDAPPRLVVEVDKERLRRYLDGGIAGRVETKPGVTRVATTDFQVTSRREGTPGVLINLEETIKTIDEFIGRRGNAATVHTNPVPPTIEYTRTYTPTENGFRALIEQFAADNEGKIGIVYQELGGKRTHDTNAYTAGAANEAVVMNGSGIESTYLAFAAHKGIEEGSIQRTDRINGAQSVEECVTEAILNNDYACSQALLDKVGNAKVQQVMREAGLTSTSFTGEKNTTTARDAATFTRKLIENDLGIRNKSALETPMRNKSMREGFIRGSAGGQVTAFSGESDEGYSEAGYVTYRGRYYVSFISEGSDAATAAKLIQAIDKLRQEKIDFKE